jgi:hypothetical protein
MISGSRFVSRRFKIGLFALSLSALSTVAIIAAAQSRSDSDLRSAGASDDALVDVHAGWSADNFAEHTVAAVAPVAAPREVSSASEKLSGTSTPAHHRVPMVTDWSTKHVVFAKPRTEAEATRLEHNTRYRMQIYRRYASPARKLADAKAEDANLLERFRNRVRDPRPVPTKADAIKRDWSATLGGNAVDTTPTPTVGPSQFPAKFSFDINAPPDCTNDFVVFNTNTPLLVAFNNLYSGTDPTSGDPNGYCTDSDSNPLSAPTVLWVYNVATNYGITSTSVTLTMDGTQVAFVESAIGGSVLHVLKWRAGDGTIDNPAYPNDVTGDLDAWAACTGANAGCMWDVPFSNDAVYETGDVRVKSDSKVRANVIQYKNAKDTNSAPYYDYDTDYLYVGTDKANIHQFANVFDGLNAVAPTGPSESGGLWPIFMNTTANPGLSGPIEDAASGRIFVSDQYGNLDFIETNTVDGIAGPCINQTSPYTYPCLAAGNYNTGANGVPDPPVVDSSLGTVMVFAGGNTIPDDSLNGHAYAAQAFTTTGCVCGSGGTTSAGWSIADFGLVSGGGGGTLMHSGDFDNTYYTGTGTGSVIGYMYVCAIDPLGTNPATAGDGNVALRQISIGANGLINGVNSVRYLKVSTTPSDQCSPVTEVYNSNANGGLGQDLVFFSVQNNSVPCMIPAHLGGGYSTAAPAGGCVMSFDVTYDFDESAYLLFHAGVAASYPEDGGTSGIILDNVSVEPQASSIYFTPLGNESSPGTCTYIGCAVKLTQNGLD